MKGGWVQIPRLREWRERRALTQVELAERAGVSERSVAGYEAGGGARPPTVRRLAEALDIEVQELRGEIAYPKEPSRSSLEPSLFNGLDDERRASIFLDAVASAADRLNVRAADRGINKWKRFGIGDAAFALMDAMHERVTEEVWETLSNELRLKLIDIAEKLLQVAMQSIDHAEDERREVEADQARERIREWTQRISA
jgi:transcriptional regulator with XRE-family HTH domain